MAISQYDFWYDRQQVRFLEQIIRAFSGFSYQGGMIAGQAPQTLMVPCRMASSNRMVANIMANLSENTLLSVPLITVSQTGFRGRKEDLQNPAHVDYLQAFERKVLDDGTYGNSRGNAFSVDRLMPLPFTMEVQVDIWTANLHQKYMLIEQIMPVIYPQFEIQNSDNPLDWTAVSVCMVDDDITFSSRTIPIGTADEIDVMSIRLHLPIWLSAPAKVKKLTRIEEVVANINHGEVDPNTLEMEQGSLYQRVIVTPGSYWTRVNGSAITLLGPEGADLLADGNPPSWAKLLDQHGLFQPTITRLKLYINNDIEGAFVTGPLQYGTEDNVLIWTLDASTLPANTLTAINAVIDPLRTFPGHGLPATANAQRYLLINDIGHSSAWGSLSARANDIIQYSSITGVWSVIFNSTATTTPEYVLNSHTSRQLRWNGEEWSLAIDGNYGPGFWRLVF